MKVQAQFFEITTGVQSGPNAFDESRFFMTFSTILGVTEILCTFRLVLEEKTGKEIPKSSRLEFLGKILTNNFSLSNAEDNISRLMNNASIADLPLLRTLQAIHQIPREPGCLEKMELFCFISIYKFSSFKNPFATITSLSALYFRFRRFILLVLTKK